MSEIREGNFLRDFLLCLVAAHGIIKGMRIADSRLVEGFDSAHSIGIMEDLLCLMLADQIANHANQAFFIPTRDELCGVNAFSQKDDVSQFIFELASIEALFLRIVDDQLLFAFLIFSFMSGSTSSIYIGVPPGLSSSIFSPILRRLISAWMQNSRYHCDVYRVEFARKIFFRQSLQRPIVDWMSM